MEEKIYVVLTSNVYDEVLNYLSKTQTYENVAKLISEVVNDVNVNSQNLLIGAKPTVSENNPDSKEIQPKPVVEILEEEEKVHETKVIDLKTD